MEGTHSSKHESDTFGVTSVHVNEIKVCEAEGLARVPKMHQIYEATKNIPNLDTGMTELDAACLPGCQNRETGGRAILTAWR